MSQFAPPSEGIKPADLLGHLVIARPLRYEPEVTTIHGVKDAVAVDVADVDTGEIYTECLWFNGVIVGRLRRHLGEIVLGHIIEGTPRPGQKPPLLFNYANEDAAAVARGQAFLKAHPEFATTDTPAPTASTPAPVPAPKPVAAPAASPAAPAGISPEVLAALPAESRALIEQLSAAQAA
ncbi:hypothetical protein [Stackebrandtia nassauensis]|uniref:Uncharacterized protein n=1 Tax=Stackebrandtia nassauensis (strain DSM 44728 / CIP 108903 / NRRL B-16338 / NBRC 102104 / LLR-40K-21) TaxID=446470 RepID=D3Q2C7_STANL|nr:hypothetical protein [Stackebrandtia nassauensis]ADD43860.1 hypothetical protein Snas_4211 [Stackebrandtia nassauensis DSM 44728]